MSPIRSEKISEMELDMSKVFVEPVCCTRSRMKWIKTTILMIHHLPTKDACTKTQVFLTNVTLRKNSKTYPKIIKICIHNKSYMVYLPANFLFITDVDLCPISMF